MPAQPSAAGPDQDPPWEARPFSRSDALVLLLFAVLTVFAYFFQLGYNNIWNPNEGFYADAVREMLDTGHFLDIYYNGELRFNKPPMIYWAIALSSSLFGMTEWAVRLPSALAGLGSIWVVYLMGRFLDSRWLGIAAALVMAFSFQFVINARYGSPAILLTFLFALTLYFFLRAYHLQRASALWLAYLFLGLTVLTKGYPYLIIIGGIAALYVLLDQRLDWRAWLRALWRLKPLPGILLTLAIGLSWPAYTYLKFGDLFYEVLMDETFRRAVSREDGGLRPFFYLEANSWGFLPYSLTLYLGLLYLIIHRFRHVLRYRALAFGMSWFLVMLVIFTASRGKIPTYFIQGHPGMSLLVAFFITRFAGSNELWGRLFRWSYIIPGVLFTLGGYAVIFVLDGHPALYGLAALPVFGLVLGYFKDIRYLKAPYFPFYACLTMYILFSAVALPFMERGYRPHDAIGLAVREEVPDDSVPILIYDDHLFSLPYYARRKVYPFQDKEAILQFARQEETLAFVPRADSSAYGPARLVWEGPFYRGSETRTLEFLINVMKDKDGEESRFQTYQMLLLPAGGADRPTRPQN